MYVRGRVEREMTPASGLPDGRRGRQLRQPAEGRWNSEVRVFIFDRPSPCSNRKRGRPQAAGESRMRMFVLRTISDSWIKSTGEAAVTYQVASVDELQDIDYRQDTHLRPVRHHFGITAFGTNAWTAGNVGDRLMPEHEEDEGSEELYIVLRGYARFEIDGNTVYALQGTLMFV